MTAPELQALVDDLVRDEDLRLHPYDDATGKELRPGDTLKGNVSIGIGRNLTGRGLSSSEAVLLNEHDLADVVNDLQTFPWWTTLSPVRQRAIANMRFNLGAGGFREFNGLLAALAAGNFPTAAWHVRRSKAAQQAKTRYQRIALMLETDAAPAVRRPYGKATSA